MRACQIKSFAKMKMIMSKCYLNWTRLFTSLTSVDQFILNTEESGFQAAFPNIMHLFYERANVFDWRPDEEVEESLSYEDSYLYYLSERLWDLGVHPIEF